MSTDRGIYVVMGVAGCGKTTVGRALAAAFGVEFVEGDDYHPPANVRRMAAGIALTDADRAGWLSAIAARLRKGRAEDKGLVVSCSALKRAYRDVLRAAVPGLRFVFLDGPATMIAERMASRRGHYMPPSLLGSQLATLERPADDEAALHCSIEAPPEQIVADLVARLRQ